MGRPSCAQQRPGELLEGVRQDHDLGALAQRVEELDGAGQGSEAGDDVGDLRHAEPVRVEQVEPVPHQDVVVGLVAGRAAQLLDPGPLGHGDPDLRDEDAFEVEGHDRLEIHRAVPS